MITCFGSSILVSLLAPYSLHKKRGTHCKGTLPELSNTRRLERIGRLRTAWALLYFLSNALSFSLAPSSPPLYISTSWVTRDRPTLLTSLVLHLSFSPGLVAFLKFCLFSNQLIHPNFQLFNKSVGSLTCHGQKSFLSLTSGFWFSSSAYQRPRCLESTECVPSSPFSTFVYASSSLWR